MVNEMELYLMAFIEGYLGPDKAYRLRNNAYKWRFKDAWRYGMMHRNAKDELEDGFSRSEVEAMDNEWELTVDAMTARIKELEAEVHEQVIDCVQMSLTRDAALSQAAHFREEAERKSTRINELELKLAARSLEEDMLHYRIAELDRKIVSSSLYQAGQLDATEAALRWAALRQSGMAPADFLRVGLAALLGEVK